MVDSGGGECDGELVFLRGKCQDVAMFHGSQLKHHSSITHHLHQTGAEWEGDRGSIYCHLDTHTHTHTHTVHTHIVHTLIVYTLIVHTQ